MGGTAFTHQTSQRHRHAISKPPRVEVIPSAGKPKDDHTPMISMMRREDKFNTFIKSWKNLIANAKSRMWMTKVESSDELKYSFTHCCNLSQLPYAIVYSYVVHQEVKTWQRGHADAHGRGWVGAPLSADLHCSPLLRALALARFIGRGREAEVRRSSPLLWFLHSSSAHASRTCPRFGECRCSPCTIVWQRCTNAAPTLHPSSGCCRCITWAVPAAWP